MKFILVIWFICSVFLVSGKPNPKIKAYSSKKMSLSLDSINLIMLNGREHKCISLYKEFAILCKKQKDYPNLVRIYILLGDAHLNLRNMTEAFENYQLSIGLGKKYATRFQTGLAHLAMAFYFHENRFFEKAWGQILAAEKISNVYRLKQLERCVLSQKGIYFRRKGDLNLALEYNKKAYQKCLQEGAPSEQFDYGINLSTAYIYANKYSEALQILNEAVEINQKKVKSKLNEANVFSALGWTYCLMGNKSQSIAFGKQALKIAEEVKNEHMLRISSRSLARTYKQFNDYKNAYTIYAQFVKYFETGLKKQQEVDIAELIKGYEVKLKEEQITRLNTIRRQEKKLLKSQLNLSNYILSSVIIGIGILVFAVFWYFNRYKEKERIKSELLLKTIEADKQRDFLNAEEKERSRVALELHDGLGSLLSSVKLRLESYMIHSKNEELAPILNDLAGACAEVRTISHNLNNFSLSMGDFENVLRASVFSFEKSKMAIYFQFTSNESVDLSEDVKHHTLRIVQELMSNAVKHAESSEIHVGVLIDNELLFAQVEDNGKGIDTAKKSDGIGLKNIEMRVKSLNGNLEIFSIPMKSTQVSIQIPLKHESN